MFIPGFPLDSYFDLSFSYAKHKHDNFAQITPREMRARKRGKTFSVDQSERQDGLTTTPLDQSEDSIQSVQIEPPMLNHIRCTLSLRDLLLYP